MIALGFGSVIDNAYSDSASSSSFCSSSPAQLGFLLLRFVFLIFQLSDFKFEFMLNFILLLAAGVS